MDPQLLAMLMGQTTDPGFSTGVPGATPGFGGPVQTATLPNTGVAPAAGAAPSPSDELIRQLLSGQFNPTVAPEKPSKGARAAAAIADALRTFAAIKSGTGPGGADFTQSLYQRQQDEAQRKSQENLLRIRTALSQREQEQQNARAQQQEDRLAKGEERQAAQDKAQAEEIKRKITAGEDANKEEILAGLSALNVEGEYDLESLAGRATARGALMRAQLQDERQARLAERTASKQELRDRDQEAESKMQREFRGDALDTLEQIESNLPKLLQEEADPQAIREKFYRYVKRRASPDDAGMLIREFESKAGPAIDAAKEQRGGQAQQAQQAGGVPALGFELRNPSLRGGDDLFSLLLNAAGPTPPLQAGVLSPRSGGPQPMVGPPAPGASPTADPNLMRLLAATGKF
jgi:hypothetical protein